MSVGISFLVRQQQSYVCLGQIEGLTRTGRSFHYPYHLLILLILIFIITLLTSRKSF